MHLYEFRVVDQGGTITQCHSVRLATDAAAVKIAKVMLAEESPGSDLEIWCLQRRIHYEPPLESSCVEI
jgi:hypothetical protein